MNHTLAGAHCTTDFFVEADVRLHSGDAVVRKEHDVRVLLQQCRCAGMELDHVPVVGVVLRRIEALDVGLKREGFRVEVARDGLQALEMFDIVQPDLVLLDVMLPKMSGIDVCRQLRKKTLTPIIMVTAKGAEIDTVVGLEVGADDYVTKPYSSRELIARIKAEVSPPKIPDTTLASSKMG